MVEILVTAPRRSNHNAQLVERQSEISNGLITSLRPLGKTFQADLAQIFRNFGTELDRSVNRGCARNVSQYRGEAPPDPGGTAGQKCEEDRTDTVDVGANVDVSPGPTCL